MNDHCHVCGEDFGETWGEGGAPNYIDNTPLCDACFNTINSSAYRQMSASLVDIRVVQAVLILRLRQEVQRLTKAHEQLKREVRDLSRQSSEMAASNYDDPRLSSR